jgi:RNA polymerase sigma-70 factor, ECF subfamily
LLSVFDEAYLTRLKARDPEAESELVREFTRPIRLKLRAKLHLPQLVDEGCQETFLRVFSHFRAGKTIDSPGRLPAFVHGVCTNVAFELLRAHRRHDQLSPEAVDPPDYRSPETETYKEEIKGIVRKVLLEMPEKDREILRLVLLQEEERDAVCDRMAVDRGYLRVLLYRAKLRFKEALSEKAQQRALGTRNLRN